jgi:hypothetical protein
MFLRDNNCVTILYDGQIFTDGGWYMSTYQELRDAFSAYRDSERRFVEENERLADEIVFGFQRFLGMPQSFIKITEKVPITKSYTPVYTLDDDGAREEKSFLRDAITHLTDGTFRFAFGVFLEEKEESFPKLAVILDVICARLGDDATVEIGGKDIHCKLQGGVWQRVSIAHDVIFQLLRDWLNHRPGDGHGMSKIGFQMGQ